MEISKLRMRVGNLELEAEGTSLDPSELLRRLAEMQTAMPASSPLRASTAGSDMELQAPSASASTISTNTIASLMNATTGSDLVLAAMAHLTLVQRKDVAMRREILDEMKAARTFYKETFSGNLSSYLDNLAKAKRLNLVAKETYALTNAERQNFERLIASAN